MLRNNFAIVAQHVRIPASSFSAASGSRENFPDNIREIFPLWTRVRICAETYGFVRQKTRGGSLNLILISRMSFLVDFRPQTAF
jgi:hypothetical protein